jgi:predicted nucleic acid-binding protein
LKGVFADTLYWVALALPHDQWHAPALAARAQLGAVQIFTTEEVLVEFLTALSSGGAYLRRQAALVVRAILEDASVTVLPASHTSFMSGLELYEQREDKAYSLTDCISMAAMRSEKLTQVLANDHHFVQEGFSLLIPRGKYA